MSSRAERLTSFDVADFALPTGREEEWRFTPVRGLANLLSDEATDGEAAALTVEAPKASSEAAWHRAPPRAEPC